MSTATPDLLARLQSAARRRAVAIVLLLGLPPAVALATLAWRFAGHIPAIAALVVGIGLIAVYAWRRVRALDRAWLIRALDLQRGDIEDSADLFYADVVQLNPLQRLQLQRLRRRLDSSQPPDLRAPWPDLRILAAVLLSAAIIAATVLWPRPPGPSDVFATLPRPSAATDNLPPRLVAQQLTITPPAYTRLPQRDSAALDAKVPQGSRLRWRLRLDPAPVAAALVFLDGRKLALERDGDDWRADTAIDVAALYRVITGEDRPLQPQRLYRIDVVADQPPRIRVTAPDTNLVQRRAGQTQWSLAFEASDDHGVDAIAQMRITSAQGIGENITFREETRSLRGRGSATRRQFAARLDLAALGMAEGDDLIVQFSVRDNRVPGPHTTRSASYILRWPAPQPTLEAGIDGLVRTVLPAYFRSQRQIIIDAEALLKHKSTLQADDFVKRSDAIGVDQRLLRLRYGQFLGEESEVASQRPLMPTNDAGDIAAQRDAEAAEEQARSESAEDDHHAGEAPELNPAQGFGRQGNLLEEFGHTHDQAEAATLLDPETRTTLRAALNEMWQSELNLRTGKPDTALPYAHKALELIKQVQQASRIYLGRVGTQLPPVDMTRRMSGKREGVSPRRDDLSAADYDVPAPVRLWNALQDHPNPAGGDTDALDAFDRWLLSHRSKVNDPLALVAASDRLRREPDCEACRSTLRNLLWPLLVSPPTAPATRTKPDRSGDAYLDALRQGESP